ncbi:MAG TPA: exo-beta-N-acetylmuramidase NamZ domain-containing protein [Thermoanaerobaculia bacterium]|nr:exo-beta-N-acetylmuramidase NamZ domain-containing protein [Thermoanaerobaculia bacterium]
MRSLQVKALYVLVAALAVTDCVSVRPPTSALDPGALGEIDRTIETAIAAHKLPGGVFHLERDGAIYEKAYGNRALVPAVEPMTIDTIFDAASITKVVATTPSIWLLIERGKIELDAPVSRYIPEFKGGWRDEITIRHLLTHTSGLRPDLDLTPAWSGYDTAIRMAIAEEPRQRPGYTFRYSDINFELLGEIVRRVSGEPLDVFAKHEIFEPLRMRDTGFRRSDVGSRESEKGAGARAIAPTPDTRNPTPASRIAPTEQTPEGMLRGVVHDPTARNMGGVAGHAGLFVTIHDLAIYCRMLLRGGAPVFKPETVAKMTSVQSPANVAVRRAGGLDLDSSFSRPRGEVFPFGSFGHTGFTGGMFWIDPFSKTFYIFLSNRVHPNGTGDVVRLQLALGTLAAEAAHVPRETPVRALPVRAGGQVHFVFGGADTNNGIDHLEAERYAPLRGMRVGLITNHTGIDRAWNPTIDLLRSAPGVTLVALFSPEHGIRGTADAKTGDERDPVSGLPVYSLYGDARKPKPEQLAGLDALVFDIQDVGVRYYTYISTMGLAMEAAAAAHIKFIVLDRVNPIGGVAFEGPLLHADESFVAWHSLPIRHGMTVGELARMFNDERHIGADLTVIPLQRWRRELWMDDAGLPWINTSPNMRSLTEATLYPGIGIVEQAVSVGRGTDTPFEILGAPYVDGAVLARELTAMSLPGIRFEATEFTPTSSNFAKQHCGGVRMTITDRNAWRPVATGVAIALVLHRLYPNDFALDKLATLLRDPATLDAIRANKPLSEIIAMWREDEAAFAARRAKYLLY